MNTAAISPLRQNALSLLEILPEDQLAAVIGFMERIKGKARSRSEEEDMRERRAAFERLERMVRPIPDLDEKKELAAWREEKFGHARLD